MKTENFTSIIIFKADGAAQIYNQRAATVIAGHRRFQEKTSIPLYEWVYPNDTPLFL
jgi:hypothetical protein